MSLVLYLTALAAGPLASLVYWFGFSWRGPSRAKTWVKALPMGILFAWLLVFEAEIGRSPIPFVVLFAWVGDVLLSRPGTRAFLFGMAAFAMAHLALIGVFMDRGIAWEAARWPLGAMVLILAVAASVLLHQRAGALRVPVLGYVALIAAMALTATFIDSGDTRVDEAILIAAALFVTSDALIAVEMFILKPGSRWRLPTALTIWPTYYGAMILFAAASVG